MQSKYPLFRSGNMVRNQIDQKIGTVLFRVERGEHYHCPHCMRKRYVSHDDTGKYFYFLSYPFSDDPDAIKNGDCCIPWAEWQLCIHHEVNSHTLYSFIHFLNKKGKRFNDKF